MKYFNNLSVLLVLFMLFSCQNNTDFELDIDSLNSQEDLYKDRSTGTEEDELETQMHWVSYLIAKTIRDSREAQQIFINTFDLDGTGTTNAVSLNDLLGSHLGDNRFKKAFRDAFYYFFTTPSSCPDDGRNPRGGPRPPGTIGGCSEEFCIQMYYSMYLDYILKDNCLEIFIPNGYDSNETLLHTTAHPLLNFGANEGYAYPEDCDNDLIISPFNLYMLGNVIVTRPSRTNAPECSYTTYDDVTDFTTFLNF